jgi:putative redox protein
VAYSAKVTWLGGRQFVGTDSTKHSMVMSSQDEENGTGMRPVDVLLAALGGCTAMGVTDILLKKRLDVRDLSVNVSGDMADAQPKYFGRIHVEYVITGTGIDRTDRAGCG